MPRRSNQSTNSVRIIAGSWRSRRLTLPAQSDIRPTPDRVKETLFNWLSAHLSNSRCLDVFAGSGSLGFEALSRGAKSCIFLDTNRDHINHLAHMATTLATTSANPSLWSFPQPLPHTLTQHPFDLIFFDPPYAQIGINQCLDWLIQQPQLWHQQSRIYIETHRHADEPDLTDWLCLRQKCYGQVRFYLLQPRQTT